MKRLLASLLAAIGLAADAAQPYTENFSAGSNGWGHSGSGYTLSYAAGNAAISFLASPVPITAVLSADTNAASGQFSGDFDAADVVMVGCDFRAETVLPSSFTMTLISGTNAFVHNFNPGGFSVGVWTTVVASLVSSENNNWLGAGTNVFAAARTNVTTLKFNIGSGILSAHTVRLDNIFIQTRPAIASFVPATNSVAVTASSLQSNVTYALESAETVTSAWSLVTTFTATNGISTAGGGTTNAGVYRLRW